MFSLYVRDGHVLLVRNLDANVTARDLILVNHGVSLQHASLGLPSALYGAALVVYCVKLCRKCFVMLATL